MTISSLALLDERLAQVGLRGQWKSEEFLARATGGPPPAGQPAVWSWSTVRRMLEEAGSAFPEAFQARRSLVFQNPGLQRGTTHTMNAGMQMILPGEVAWAHRHSIAALRFIVQGNPGLYTKVDGEECVMENHDLVLTPNWAWHDHHNLSETSAYWLDVLDVPLVLALNQVFYQAGDAEAQPERRSNAQIYRRLRYPWNEVAAALDSAPVTAHDGAIYNYENGMGGPTLPTLHCMAHGLPPDFSTRKRRRTSSAIYFVVKGTGCLEASSDRFEWATNDTFVVPNWAEHRLINYAKQEEAILFSVHDAPVLQSLGLFRETLE